jgi:hypothetical protein
MNKQELIEKLDEIITNYKERAKDKYVLPSSKNILMSRVYGLAQAKTLVEELEEIPLVTVPWSIEEHMKACKFAGDNLHESILSASSEICGWYMANSEIYEQAWTNGYEVEKEPLYLVKVPILNWNGDSSEFETKFVYLVWNITSGEYNLSAIDKDTERWRASLTESEIKSIDERYWAFAVQVEEPK